MKTVKITIDIPSDRLYSIEELRTYIRNLPIVFDTKEPYVNMFNIAYNALKLSKILFSQAQELSIREAKGLPLFPIS